MTRPSSDMDTWVLAGQSNMQGCGWLAGALEPDERVWSFSSAGQWQAAAEPLHRLWESFTPVHQELMRAGMPEADRPIGDEEWARRENETRTIGAGLGLSFGRAMADALGRPIGLIPAAHGGTSLDQWSPKLKGLAGRSLYGAMLQRIERAGGRLRGILWYQGESDATAVELGRTYAERFDAWIAAARADTGIPDLPVIAVQIGRVLEPADRAGVWPGWDLVREALGVLPQRVPFTAATSAIDLPLVDIIHIDTPGLIRLGRRLARQALRLTEGAGAVGRPSGGARRALHDAGGRAEWVARRLQRGDRAWRRRDNIRGFEVRLPEAQYCAPLFVVNAWVDASDADNAVMVLLNREPEPGVELGYGLGIDPVCDLVDEADAPLCAFLPRPVAD